MIIYSDMKKNIDYMKYMSPKTRLDSSKLYFVFQKNSRNPILDTMISSGQTPYVTLVLAPLKSETSWIGELWSNRVLLILKN